MPSNNTRREFLKSSARSTAAALAVPYWFSSTSLAQQGGSANDRLVLGAIGTGDRWGSMRAKDAVRGVGGNAMKFGDYISVCDADAERKERARALTGGKAEMHEDYRRVLDNNEIDVVTIVTPDHWHSKIAIEAMRAGKDVYCEKPLTLTIEEGKQIRKVLEQTGRVFQVGTQQRSEYRQMFLNAVAIARSGRLGNIRRVTCAIGGAPTSGEIPTASIPSSLNWDLWLGQAPQVEYRMKKDGSRWGKSRCHYEFRWWYEYSGGKMTDWGAHHVDIAQWAIGMENSGPSIIEPLEAEHPVPYKNGHPQRDDQYNAATTFKVRCEFPNGVEMFIRHNANDLGFGNGIMIEGDKGRILVNRGKLAGKPVEELKDNPLPEDTITKLYKGKQPGDHMRNFVECIKDRTQPISDVATHHRSMTTCHLANIAIRLGRTLKWNPETEQIVGDEEANTWQTRKQRKGYEINV